MVIYRSRYLTENTLGDTEVKDQFSKVALIQLTSFNNPNIQHSLNGGEMKILGDKVDGFDCETRTVYQFQGCFFHGCPDCYYPKTQNPVNKKTMGELYEKTNNHCRQLRIAGYTVIEMWECKWVKSLEYRKSKKSGFVLSLKPRDAFTGGSH